MELNRNNIVLLISLSSLLFSFSAEALCAPRDHSRVAPRPSPAPKDVKSAPAPDPPKVAPAPAPKPKAPVPTPKVPVAEAKAPTPAVPKPAASKAVPGELSRLCGLSENPAYCVETILPFLNASTDGVSILKAAMQANLVNLNSAVGEAKKIEADPKTAPLVKKTIGTCVELYESAVEDIDTCFTAIETKDVGSLVAHLDAVLTQVGTCEDTFDETPGLVSPMQETDKKLYMIIDNSLAIRNAVRDTIRPPVVV